MASDEGCVEDGQIASYVEGRASHETLEGIEAHLGACSACARVAIEVARAARSATNGALVERARIFAVDQVIAGRYRIATFLGAGGMGEVYEAHDEELGERIALKTVSAAATFDDQAVARLKAEVLLARKVTHRNVCRIFDFGIHVDAGEERDQPIKIPFLTMELLASRTLADFIRSGHRFAPGETLAIVRQMAAGLAAAHDAGVIHRDLKSDNVLLLSTQPGPARAVITDFGLAGRVLAETAHQAMSTGSSVYGTRQYMAPERAAGGSATAATDLYSLGLVMSELLSGTLVGGRPARAGDGGLKASTTTSQSGRVAAVMRQCLERTPEERPSSAWAVLAALSEPGAGAARPRRRRWAVSLGLVAIGALVVTAATAVSSRSRQTFGDSTPLAVANAVAAQAPLAPASAVPVTLPAVAAAASAAKSPAGGTRLLRRNRAPRALSPTIAEVAPSASAVPARAPASLPTAETVPAPDAPIRSLAVRPRPPVVHDDAPIDPFQPRRN